MILVLAQSAAILAGLGSTVRLGEDAPAALIAADVQSRAWRAEAQLDLAHKVETGDGWQGDIAAEYTPAGWLGVGARYSYRHTSAWGKHGPWLRVGLHSGPASVLVDVAPNSANREAVLALRFRQCYRRLCGETRAFVETHSAVSDGSYGYGVAGLAGIELRRTR